MVKKKELPPDVPRLGQRTRCADNNDGLGWTVGFSFDLDGMKFGFRTNEPGLLPRLRELVPSSAAPIDDLVVDCLFSLLVGAAPTRKGVKNYHLAYEGWGRIARSLDLEAVLRKLSDYARVQFAGMSKQRTFVNCPLLVWKNSGILVCGDSLAANRTLVEALASQGAEIVCPDYTGIGDNLSLWSLDQPACLEIEPELVVFASHTEKGSWRPSRLSGPQSALELIGRTHNVRVNPAPTLARLTSLALNTAQSYKGVYRNPDRVVPFIAERLNNGV